VIIIIRVPQSKKTFKFAYSDQKIHDGRLPFSSTQSTFMLHDECTFI